MATETVGMEGMTLSQVIWKRFRRQPLGYIERVLELNPGISAGIILSVGTVIKLPLDLPTETAETEVVRLWD
ncbi:tail protein X [Hoeflea sp.]|uniref:tail protein X n=1 Tax=Hoeflea sp. TaxID=1940281 RepID=UPI003B51D564